MSNKRKVEVFSAGCPVCEEAAQMIKTAACPSCEVEVLDMHQPSVAASAEAYSVRSVPAEAVDGALPGCWAGRGVDEATLRAVGVGTPLP